MLCIPGGFHTIQEGKCQKKMIMKSRKALLHTNLYWRREKRIKRWINMTKVGQLFEEEKQEALRKLEEEQRQEIKRIKKAKKEAVKEAEKQSSRTIARRMLEKGMEPSEIWSFIPNLSYRDIEELKE